MLSHGSKQTPPRLAPPQASTSTTTPVPPLPTTPNDFLNTPLTPLSPTLFGQEVMDTIGNFDVIDTLDYDAKVATPQRLRSLYLRLQPIVDSILTRIADIDSAQANLNTNKKMHASLQAHFDHVSSAMKTANDWKSTNVVGSSSTESETEPVSKGLNFVEPVVAKPFVLTNTVRLFTEYQLNCNELSMFDTQRLIGYAKTITAPTYKKTKTLPTTWTSAAGNQPTDIAVDEAVALLRNAHPAGNLQSLKFMWGTAAAEAGSRVCEGIVKNKVAYAAISCGELTAYQVVHVIAIDPLDAKDTVAKKQKHAGKTLLHVLRKKGLVLKPFNDGPTGAMPLVARTPVSEKRRQKAPAKGSKSKRRKTDEVVEVEDV